MKKKFLSLMMAAAVVATTSVSAFAAENNVHVTMPKDANVTDMDDQQPTQDVELTGHVQSDKGEMPTTSFKVTVPTAANFTVTSQGNLVGPELTIKNEGTQGVDVYAHNFSKTGNGKINVVSESEISNSREGKPRTTISLKLVVDGKNKAFLKASNGESGVYKEADLGNDHKAPEEGVKLLSLGAGAGANGATTKKIKIEGTAGKNTGLTNPESDTFKLVLKIKKSENIKENQEVSNAPGVGVAPGR